MKKFHIMWASFGFAAGISLGILINILYTDHAVNRNNEIACPLYSILDRPVTPVDRKDPNLVKIREAIHEARVKYDCPPPLISPTTTRTTSGS